jgi:hypothetical protein
MAIARDKFWMFGVRAHQDDCLLAPRLHGTNPTYSFRSRITPAEGAFMLDIPNILMIQCDGEPAPFSGEARGYMESFCRMDRVLWGSAGSGGFRVGNEEAFVCELAEKYPNITGVFLDDVSSAFHKVPDQAERHRLRVQMLAEVKENLKKAPRPMDVYITWYWHQDPYPGMMEYVDGISFWTWNSDELVQLPERFEAVEEKYKDKKILLGIYMYDFYNRKPVPNELMELQCNYALELLKQGRIDGMIFEANSVMGARLPSEYWLREWIETAKYTEVPD